MNHESRSSTEPMDHDLDGYAPPAEPAPDIRLRGKSLEIPLPGHEASTGKAHSEEQVIEEFQKWKSEFLRAAERSLRRMGLGNIQVVDFRSLKHWDLSFYPKGEPRHPTIEQTDTLWRKAMRDYFRLNPDIEKAAESADDDDFVILVRYTPPKKDVVDDTATDTRVMWIRRVTA